MKSGGEVIGTLADSNTVPFDEAKLKIPLEATAWPADRAERVGVNSFGIGGANAHVGHDTQSIN